MGSDIHARSGTSKRIHFNPRPRVGSDACFGTRTACKTISIHVPAWGATGATIGGMSGIGISIHVPAWGATRCSSVIFAQNSISIHVPAWGATQEPKSLVTANKFQSTSPRGERPHRPILFRSSGHFNPRPRVGSDVIQRYFPLYLKNFNPRPRVGSDLDKLLPIFKWFLFQSTSPRGERRRLVTQESLTESFQSTSPRGERPVRGRPLLEGVIFQSTSPRGERRFNLHQTYTFDLFQSTSPRGERLNRATI